MISEKEQMMIVGAVWLIVAIAVWTFIGIIAWHFVHKWW